MPQQPYQFLLLDADNTLLDFDRDMEEAFHRMFARCFPTVPYNPGYLAQYEKANARWWAKLERGECTKPQLFLGRFTDFFRKTGLSGDSKEVNQVYFTMLGEGGALLPGALDFVKRLARHHQLYIITNGNAASQKTRLAHSGLMSYVLDFFVSEDAGAAKPDPLYFNYVFSRIPGFAKERALVIGDTYNSDIKGAANAGLPCIWYNPKKELPTEKLPVLLEARDFESILRYLGHA